MTTTVYKPGHDSNNKWFPNGPGDGFSYYSGTLYPHTRFDHYEEVQALCIFLNIAYESGYLDQRDKTLTALGLDSLIKLPTPIDDNISDSLRQEAFREGQRAYKVKVRKILDIKD